MNLVAIEKLEWLISRIWGNSASEYIASICSEYDQSKSVFLFLKELNTRGDELNIVRIINHVFMSNNFKSTYESIFELILFRKINVTSVANELIELLEMEGYNVEKFKVNLEKGREIRPSVNIVDEKFNDEKFYFDLVKDINWCYRYGIPSATGILLRKMFENLLIDLLRGKYGTAKLDLFYWKERGRFNDFTTLLSNFKDNLEDFMPYSSGLNDEVIGKIAKFQELGNSNAHSIDSYVTIKSLEKQREEINYLIHLLSDLKRKVRTDKT